MQILKHLLIYSVILTTASTAKALSAVDAVNLAEQNDPTFKSSQANQDAMSARSDIAMSNLLPQLKASARKSQNNRDYTTLSETPTTTEQRYTGDVREVTLTQPIWQHEHLIGLKQADFVLEQAGYQLKHAKQDLLIRLAQAWFDLMQARDMSIYKEQQVKATEYFWRQAQKSSGQGLTSEPALQEARSKYDQAIAEFDVAKTDQYIKLATLETITGPIENFTPPQFGTNEFQMPSVEDSLENCMAFANSNNPSVLAAFMGVAAANAEIRKQRSGHEPTLELVMSYSENEQGAGTDPGQSAYDYTQKVAELRLTIPLYSGGGQSAKVREAIAMNEKAMHDLESAKNNTYLACKQSWHTWHSSSSQITAGLQTNKFLSTSYDSMIAAKANGLKTDGDVLQANEKRQGAIRDLQKARYEAFMSVLKFKAAMGSLEETNFTVIDSFYSSSAVELYNSVTTVQNQTE